MSVNVRAVNCTRCEIVSKCYELIKVVGTQCTDTPTRSKHYLESMSDSRARLCGANPGKAPHRLRTTQRPDRVPVLYTVVAVEFV